MDIAPTGSNRYPEANRLLLALGARARRQLLAVCKPVELGIGEILSEPGQSIRHVYFPIDCCISLRVAVTGRNPLEVALVGNEGMLGLSLVLGIQSSQLQAVVHVPGSALRIRSTPFCRRLALEPTLRRLLTRYVWVRHTQLACAVACKHFHTLDKRFATFLLTTQDRSHGRSLHLTHAALGQLMGVRRVGVTHAASALQNRELIRYSRGQITILDRRGLEKAACGCHQTAIDTYQRMLG